MNQNDTDKSYQSVGIPKRTQQQNTAGGTLPVVQNIPPSAGEAAFFELELAPETVAQICQLEAEQLTPQPQDPIRELFTQMRNIARANSKPFEYFQFFDRQIQQNNAKIFYKQGVFMQDFCDDFDRQAPFSQYFPYYQMMGYEQLRTYFTWRTKVRQGKVENISLSYAFLYIYELLNNIGTKDAQHALDLLVEFWQAFRVHNVAIDRYVLRWFLDYHVYYQLEHSFVQFVDKHNLMAHYPALTDNDSSFNLFCSVSKYDMRKSLFFADNRELATDCFDFVLQRLREVFAEKRLSFDQFVFAQQRTNAVWTPFAGALFFDRVKQADRKVVLSQKEVFVCRQNKWTCDITRTTRNGWEFVGFVIKLIETTLRKITNFKYKISARVNDFTQAAVNFLNKKGICIEQLVVALVNEFYHERTKTVVNVNFDALTKIRTEAQLTQQKLIVADEFEQKAFVAIEQPSPKGAKTKNSTLDKGWTSFKQALCQTEVEALSALLYGQVGLKEFADKCGIMLELLVDGINSKAFDTVGDNILDEEFCLYDDYKQQVKETVS